MFDNIVANDLSGRSLAAWYLIASCAYYEYNASVISDAAFDNICRRLLVKLDAGEDLKHEDGLIVRENLECGSCLGVTYPEEIRTAARAWIERL